MVAKHQENTNKDGDIYRSHPFGSSTAEAQLSWSTPAWCSAALSEPRPRFAPALAWFWMWVKVSYSAETELLHWWQLQQISFITSASWRPFVGQESEYLFLKIHTYIRGARPSGDRWTHCAATRASNCDLDWPVFFPCHCNLKCLRDCSIIFTSFYSVCFHIYKYCMAHKHIFTRLSSA